MTYFEVVSLLEERTGDLEAVLTLEAQKREDALSAAAPTGPTFFMREGSAAIIPVRGVLLDEWSPYGPRWGATGYNYVRNAVEQAAGDSNVRAIIMDYDSPGGLVAGVEETSNVIERNGKRYSGKPIFSVMRSTCASACYNLASNGDTLIASPSTRVGSIGAKLTHISLQGMLERGGVKVTEIASHAGKADTGPYKDLSDTAKARLEAEVKDAAEIFVQRVARRRRMSVKEVHALNAEVFPAQSAAGRKTALAAGLIDHVASADDVVREILSQSRL